MEILEHGNTFYNDNKTVICNYCHCKMLYNISELKEKEDTKNKLIHYKYIVCPECNKDIIMEVIDNNGQ